MELVRFAKLFDHSIVRPDAIRFAAGRLRGSGVLVGTVVGFPHGNETPSMKVYQTKEVLGLGAD